LIVAVYPVRSWSRPPQGWCSAPPGLLCPNPGLDWRTPRRIACLALAVTRSLGTIKHVPSAAPKPPRQGGGVWLLCLFRFVPSSLRFTSLPFLRLFASFRFVPSVHFALGQSTSTERLPHIAETPCRSLCTPTPGSQHSPQRCRQTAPPQRQSQPTPQAEQPPTQRSSQPTPQARPFPAFQ